MAQDDERVAEWQAAGLYDPDDPGAAGCLALLDWIASQGMTTEDMLSAQAEGQLTALVGDRELRPPATVSTSQIADRTGLPIEMVEALRRATGFPPVPRNVASYTEQEVLMFELFAAADAFFSSDQLLHFVRVMASSLRRIGEAASEMFLRDVEAPLQQDGNYDLAVAMAILEGVHLVDTVTGVFEPMFRSHLQATVRTGRHARRGAVDFTTVPLTVGFVDLGGFTARTLTMTPEELLQLVVAFESTALDLVSQEGGRLIKLIGDEVMFTTVSAVDACRIALGMLRAARGWGVNARGGLAHGQVVTSGGDVYGTTVNLASRIADVAVPGEVLVDEGVATNTPSMPFEPAGRRLLKGFGEPVRLWSLEP